MKTYNRNRPKTKWLLILTIPSFIGSFITHYIYLHTHIECVDGLTGLMLGYTFVLWAILGLLDKYPKSALVQDPVYSLPLRLLSLVASTFFLLVGLVAIARGISLLVP